MTESSWGSPNHQWSGQSMLIERWLPPSRWNWPAIVPKSLRAVRRRRRRTRRTVRFARILLHRSRLLRAEPSAAGVGAVGHLVLRRARIGIRDPLRGCAAPKAAAAHEAAGRASGHDGAR